MSKIIDFFKGSEKDDAQHQEVRKKINALLAAGQSLHLKREETLTAYDKELLRKELKARIIITTLVLAFIGILFIGLGEGLLFFLGALIVVAIYPLVRYQQKDMQRLLNENKKEVIRGIITKKFTKVLGRKDRSTHYWLVLGENEFEVSHSRYKKYNIGDAAEFHTVEFPKRVTHILFEEKLEQAGIN